MRISVFIPEISDPLSAHNHALYLDDYPIQFTVDQLSNTMVSDIDRTFKVLWATHVNKVVDIIDGYSPLYLPEYVEDIVVGKLMFISAITPHPTTIEVVGGDITGNLLITLEEGF